jgi:hypothetical protein
MIRSSAILVTALTLPSFVSLTAAAGVSSINEPASQSIIIHCGKLIDRLSETLFGARWVRIDKGVITAVDNTSRPVVAGPDIDLQDYTCSPKTQYRQNRAERTRSRLIRSTAQ